MRGPTTGSDNPKRLDGKLVVITGKKICHKFIYLSGTVVAIGKFTSALL